MKRWVNVVIVSVCVLLIVGGCHEATAKSDESPVKAKTEVVSLSKAPAQESATLAKAPAAAQIPAATITPPAAPVTAPVASKPAGPAPQIKFENTSVDLGDIKPSSKNVANYTFSNIGKVDLKILDIQKTCGCTPFELTKREYAPGESGTIKVEYQATKAAGPVLKHLFVMTDDPNNQRVEITLKANIVLKAALEPMELKFSLEDPSANEQAITVFSKDNVPFSIKSIESNDNVVTAQIDPNAKAARFVVKLKVDREKLKGNLNGTIKFNITHPDIDMLVATYSAMPEFEVQPPSLILRSATPKQAETRELWVKNNYSKPFDVESVSSKNGYIKVLKQEKVDNMYKLMIEITPPELQKVMFFSDTLMIKVKNDQTLEVACRGFFRRAK